MKIKNLFNKLGKTTQKLMYYGSMLSFGLLIVGVISYVLNIHLWQENFLNKLWSIKIVSASLSLMVQTFFFSLLFDCVRLSKK